MERLCMRPGCDRTAVARLSYDPVACQVWLDPVLEWAGPLQEICELHSSRLTVPRGWMLCDRREDEPALFVPEASTTDAAPPARSTDAPAERERSADATNGSARPTNGSASPAPPRTAVAHPATRRRTPAPRTAAARTAEARAAVVRRAVRPPTGRRTSPVAPPEPELFDPVVEPDDGGAQQAAPTSLEPAARPRRVGRRVAQTAPIPGATPSRTPTAPASQEDAPAPATVEAAQVEDLDVQVTVEIEVETQSAATAQPDVAGEAAATADPPSSEDAPSSDPASGDPASGDDADHDALPESLQATSPLLSRAFRATGPQRSVLSQTLLNDAD